MSDYYEGADYAAERDEAYDLLSQDLWDNEHDDYLEALERFDEDGDE